MAIYPEFIPQNWEVIPPQTDFQLWAVHMVVRNAIQFSIDHDTNKEYDVKQDRWRELLREIQRGNFYLAYLEAANFVAKNSPSNEVNDCYLTGTYGVRVSVLRRILMASQYTPQLKVGENHTPMGMQSKLIGINPYEYGVMYTFKIVNSYGHIEYITEFDDYSNLFFNRGQKTLTFGKDD